MLNRRTLGGVWRVVDHLLEDATLLDADGNEWHVRGWFPVTDNVSADSFPPGGPVTEGHVFLFLDLLTEGEAGQPRAGMRVRQDEDGARVWDIQHVDRKLHANEFDCTCVLRPS